MEAGAALFSAELAMRAFTGDRLFPYAAPIGGSTMMLSWLALAIVFAAAGRRQETFSDVTPARAPDGQAY